jgi:hypothetical protein
MKIAMLVMVHKNPKQAQRLVDHLSKDFDVYVHVDKRARWSIKGSDKVFVYKKYKPYWASFNITLAQLFLLRQAHKRRYDRYTVISGLDLPLASNERIEKFFKDDNNDYIAFTSKIEERPLSDRLTEYHLDEKYREFKNIFRRLDIFHFTKEKVFEILNKKKTRRLDYDFYKGSQWMNLTGAMVLKMLDYLRKDKKYLRRFRWTRASDEIFFQTLAKMQADVNIINDNLRYIDWVGGSNGSPKTLLSEDYEKLIESDKLFARKFDESIDGDIIDRMYERI